MPEDSSSEPQSEARFTIVATGLVLLIVFVPALSAPFLSDDYVHVGRAQHGSGEQFAQWLTEPGGDGFFRPIGYCLLALIGLLAEADPTRWRLAVLLLHVLNCSLLFGMARRLGWSRWEASIAAAVFALHGTRPEAVFWISSIFDLAAAFFCFLAVLQFLDYCREPRIDRAAFFVVSLCLALLSKEVAFALPLFLMLTLVTLPRREDRGRAIRLLAVGCAATAAIFVYRYSLLGGIGGYVDPGDGTPLILGFSVFSSFKVILFRLWGPLYFPINWSVEGGAGLWLALLLGVAGYWAMAARGGMRRERAVLAFGFLLFFAAPALHQLLVGQDLEKSRLFYLPSAGFALLIAAALGGMSQRRERLAAAAMLLTFQAAALSHNLDIWRDVAGLADEACSNAAAAVVLPVDRISVQGLPGSIDGVYFFRNGFPECVQMRASRPLTLSLETIGAASPTPNAEHLVLRWNAERRRLD